VKKKAKLIEQQCIKSENYKIMYMNETEKRNYEIKVEKQTLRRKKYFKYVAEKINKKKTDLSDILYNFAPKRKAGNQLLQKKFKKNDLLMKAFNEISTKDWENKEKIKSNIKSRGVFSFERDVLVPPSLEYIKELKETDVFRYLRYILYTSDKINYKLPKICVKRLFELIDTSSPGLDIRKVIDDLTCLLNSKAGNRVKSIKKVLNKVWHGMTLESLARKVFYSENSFERKEHSQAKQIMVKYRKKHGTMENYKSKKRWGGYYTSSSESDD
jgi:hypothetical protein